MAKNYELVKKITVLGGKEGGNTKEINIVRWGVFPPDDRHLAPERRRARQGHHP